MLYPRVWRSHISRLMASDNARIYSNLCYLFARLIGHLLTGVIVTKWRRVRRTGSFVNGF